MPRAVSQQVVVSAVFVAVMFMNIMDSTVVIVALPTLARSFGVPTSSVSGVVTAYLVTLAVAMPVSGWLGERFGGRAVLLAAITVFTGASALCGLATSLPELVAFRALQGLGGGTLIPVGTTMITRAFPPAERIKANRVLAGPTLLAPALGPVIGGALVDGLSWRWIFYINLPVGVAALLIGLLFLPRGSQQQAGRFDLPGFLLAAAGFPLLLYALSVGASAGWGSAGVLGTRAGRAGPAGGLRHGRAAGSGAAAAAAALPEPALPGHHPAAGDRVRRVQRRPVPGPAAAADRPRLLRRALGAVHLHRGRRRHHRHPADVPAVPADRPAPPDGGRDDRRDHR